MEGYQEGSGRRREVGKGTENKQHKWLVENRQGEGKNSIGNVEAKELTCMSHGHELKLGNDGGRGGTGQRGIKGRKKWDNCNSIINKYIYFLKSQKNQENNPQSQNNHDKARDKLKLRDILQDT